MARLKVKDETRVPDLLAELKFLNDAEIEIGIFGGKKGSKTLMIASVHEFGVTIKPKKAMALTIPLNEEAAGKRAGEFEGLFRPKGTNILALKNKDGSLKPMYALKKQVTIPERSYIRGAFDTEYKKILKELEKAFRSVIAGRINAKRAVNIMGEWLVSLTRKYMVELDTPPNAEVTQKLKKNQDNPLVDSGRLRQSITYRIR